MRCQECVISYEVSEIPAGSTTRVIQLARKAWFKRLHRDVWQNKPGWQAAEEHLTRVNVALDHLLQCGFRVAEIADMGVFNEDIQPEDQAVVTEDLNGVAGNLWRTLRAQEQIASERLMWWEPGAEYDDQALLWWERDELREKAQQKYMDDTYGSKEERACVIPNAPWEDVLESIGHCIVGLFICLGLLGAVGYGVYSFATMSYPDHKVVEANQAPSHWRGLDVLTPR